MATRPPSKPDAGAEPKRALGRGLEDVSHLFLTRRQAEPAPPRTERTPAPAHISTATVVARPWREPLAREQLRALLAGCADALGEPLTPIATALTCDRSGEIDLLATDANGRLVVVDLEPGDGEALLLRGLAHVGWLTRNLSLLRSNYDGPNVNFRMSPRLVVIAQRFPAFFQDAVQAAGAKDVQRVRYHALDLGGRLGVYFERLDEETTGGQFLPDIVFT